jgi:hypothetical protein
VVNGQGSGVRGRNLLFVVLIFFFLVDIFRIEGWTGVAVRAAEASFVGAAGTLFRRQLVAFLSLRDDFHSLRWEREETIIAFYILRGDLDTVEEESGSAGIEFRGAKGGENLGEGHLDGATIFKNGKPEGLIGSGDRRICKPMETGMVVAIGLAAQGRRLAFTTVGHDVTALVIHSGFLSPYPHPYSANKVLILHEDTACRPL